MKRRRFGHSPAEQRKFDDAKFESRKNSRRTKPIPLVDGQEVLGKFGIKDPLRRKV